MPVNYPLIYPLIVPSPPCWLARRTNFKVVDPLSTLLSFIDIVVFHRHCRLLLQVLSEFFHSPSPM